jgi:hypothetical protein
MRAPQTEADFWWKAVTVALFIAAMFAFLKGLTWMQTNWAWWSPVVVLPVFLGWAFQRSYRDPDEWEISKAELRDIWRVWTFRKPLLSHMQPRKIDAATKLTRWFFAVLFAIVLVGMAINGFQ